MKTGYYVLWLFVAIAAVGLAVALIVYDLVAAFTERIIG